MEKTILDIIHNIDRMIEEEEEKNNKNYYHYQKKRDKLYCLSVRGSAFVKKLREIKKDLVMFDLEMKNKD